MAYLLFQMADEYLFDNDESDEEKAFREKEELALDAKERWFGIANSTGYLFTVIFLVNGFSLFTYVLSQ